MRVRVKENAPPGSYVTTITASNSNSASVSFELEENKSNIFWIDPSTGVILVGKGRGLLDRESKSSHEITVKATNLVSINPSLFPLRGQKGGTPTTFLGHTNFYIV